MIHVLLHVDGLLERFGRAVPDAAAMISAITRIQARLEAGPRGAALEWHAVRFDRVPDARAFAERRALLGDLGRLGLSGLPTARTRLVPDGARLRAALPEAEDVAAIILLTASHSRFEEALALGMTAFHVGLGTPPERRGLPFGDVPRMLEEKLRIPTARPMAAGVRTGGLLAIATRSRAAGRALALEAMQADPNADWVTLGSTLVLYTEDPDLEDRLAEEPDVDRLSYGVHKTALVFHPEPGPDPSAALYRGSGLALHESAGSEARDPASDRPSLPWNVARRRILGGEDPTAAEPQVPPPPQGTYEVARERFDARLAAATGGTDGDAAEPLLAAVRDVVGPTAAADLPRRGGVPAALTWTTPFRVDDRDELVVCVHHPPTPAARAATTSAALAVDHALSTLPTALGVLHCVRLADDASPDWLLGAALRDDEQHRVSAIVVLEDLRALERADTGLRITADPGLGYVLPPGIGSVRRHPRRGGGPPRLEIRGASAPSSSDDVSAVLAILTRLVA